jgi:hypothetical protein
LLSREFLELARAHLKPGGVFYFNATFSPDGPYTAARVFRHVAMYGNFVAASDSAFLVGRDEALSNLRAFRHAGAPVFAPERPDRWKVAEDLASYPLVDRGNELRARNDLWLITDDNVAPEFKNPRGGAPLVRFNDDATWRALFRRLTD